MSSTHSLLFIGCTIAALILVLLCLIRAIKGPRLVDRIMAVNMMGTLIVVTIILSSIFLGETSLLDIGMIYVALSFIAVIVLAEVYIGNHRRNKYYKDGEGKEGIEDDR